MNGLSCASCTLNELSTGLVEKENAACTVILEFVLSRQLFMAASLSKQTGQISVNILSTYNLLPLSLEKHNFLDNRSSLTKSNLVSGFEQWLSSSDQHFYYNLGPTSIFFFKKKTMNDLRAASCSSLLHVLFQHDLFSTIFFRVNTAMFGGREGSF